LNVRSEKLKAYVQKPDSIKMENVSSFAFIAGMTIHPLRGTLTRSDVEMESYARLRAVQTGPVWFRRGELVDALELTGGRKLRGGWDRTLRP